MSVAALKLSRTVSVHPVLNSTVFSRRRDVCKGCGEGEGGRSEGEGGGKGNEREGGGGGESRLPDTAEPRRTGSCPSSMATL